MKSAGLPTQHLISCLQHPHQPLSPVPEVAPQFPPQACLHTAPVSMQCRCHMHTTTSILLRSLPCWTCEWLLLLVMDSYLWDPCLCDTLLLLRKSRTAEKCLCSRHSRHAKALDRASKPSSSPCHPAHCSLQHSMRLQNRHDKLDVFAACTAACLCQSTLADLVNIAAFHRGFHAKYSYSRSICIDINMSPL